MKGIVGTLLIIVIVVLAAGAGGYFLLPSKASGTATFTVDRPAASVFARLASTPAGTALVQNVTLTEITSAQNNVVTGKVAYDDGVSGEVAYTVTPQGAGSRVDVRLDQALGTNPLTRLGALTGGKVGPIAEAAAASATADLGALPATSFEGLAYEVVQVEAQPFFYVQNCSPTDPETITSIVQQAFTGVRAVMATLKLEQAGPPMAVEPRVVNGQYCYQVGVPYRGAAPGVLAIGTAGQSPSGVMLRMVYAGPEETVVPEVYDRMDALLAAARLDDPGTPDDDWTTYEVYLDDPMQSGGSRNREVFYVTQGDISRLTAITPPTALPPTHSTQPASEPASATPTPSPASPTP